MSHQAEVSRTYQQHDGVNPLCGEMNWRRRVIGAHVTGGVPVRACTRGWVARRFPTCNQGGACGAAGPTSAPGSARGRPPGARRAAHRSPADHGGSCSQAERRHRPNRLLGTACSRRRVPGRPRGCASRPSGRLALTVRHARTSPPPSHLRRVSKATRSSAPRARRLGIRLAILRKCERAGVIRPRGDPHDGLPGLQCRQRTRRPTRPPAQTRRLPAGPDLCVDRPSPRPWRRRAASVHTARLACPPLGQEPRHAHRRGRSGRLPRLPGRGRVGGATVARGEMFIRFRARRAARRWPGRWRRAWRRSG
jgi:hypothetical protein